MLSLAPLRRKSPHCRTCGKPMKGHKTTLCQLRSPSEDSLGRSSSDKENRAFGTPEVEDDDDADWFRASPPSSRSASSGSSVRSEVNIMSSHAARPAAVTNPIATGSNASNATPPYPLRPITPELSWSLPPPGTSYHRQNPHVLNQHYKVLSPVRRTNSWVSTEKADDDEVDDIPTPNGSFSMTNRQITPPRQLGPAPPLAAAEGPVVLDTAGKRVLGIDLSTLSDNLKTVLEQAEEAGLMAAIVRPRIGYNRGTIDVRTEADADKHTTVFVATGPDTLSINMVYTDTLKKTKLMNDEIAGNLKVQGFKFWVVVFGVTFLATLVAVVMGMCVVGVSGVVRDVLEL